MGIVWTRQQSIGHLLTYNFRKRKLFVQGLYKVEKMNSFLELYSYAIIEANNFEIYFEIGWEVGNICL